MKSTINDIAKILRRDDVKGDTSHYGVVVGIIENEDGYTTGYEVSLGGSSDVIECRKFAGANVGDVVLVTHMRNGAMVVTGRRDGDGDTANLIGGLDDGSFSINGECLDSIGVSDKAFATGGGMGFQGESTTMMINNGVVDVNYEGEQVFTVRSSANAHDTLRFNINLAEDDSVVLDHIFNQAIAKVSITYSYSKNWYYYSGERVITQSAPSSKPYVWYTMNNGKMTIHNRYIRDGWAYVVRSVTVETIPESEQKMLDIAGKVYADASGNMFAKSFTQVNAPMMSSAPSGGNGIDTPESSREIKHDIKPCEFDVEKLYDVPVVQFKFNEDYLSSEDERYGKDIIGLIAEDVEAVLPIAVDHDREHPMWNILILVPAMLKLIQKQHNEIELLKEKVNALQ